jgi:hypothetical protein
VRAALSMGLRTALRRRYAARPSRALSIIAFAAAAAAAAACRAEPTARSGSGGSAVQGAPAPGPGSGPACTSLPFAEFTPVPEASGAAWLPLDGAPALLVISDSGNDGAYAIVDADSGVTREQGKLPLGGGGDDLEGVAARGDRFYAISSPGWIRVYERRGRGFALADGPYPLGPIDLEERGSRLGDEPPKGAGMVCAEKHANCGRNYEGICLAPAGASARCIGFAAAKADGHLYCLVESAGRLAVEYSQAIKIARPGVISDCAFSDDGRLYVGTNTFDAGNVYRVTGWEDPAHAALSRVGPLLVGFTETVAVRDDVIYRMSDLGTAPSAMKKFRCPGR